MEGGVVSLPRARPLGYELTMRGSPWCTLAVLAALCVPAAPTAAAAPAGAVCVRREPHLPIDEAGGLAPVALPRGLYSMHVDRGPRIDVRPDRGTLVTDLDASRRHSITLRRREKAVASMHVRLRPGETLCVGVANYGGLVIAGGEARACGCPAVPSGRSKR
jgi:hypothetical protein